MQKILAIVIRSILLIICLPCISVAREGVTSAGEYSLVSKPNLRVISPAWRRKVAITPLDVSKNNIFSVVEFSEGDLSGICFGTLKSRYRDPSLLDFTLLKGGEECSNLSGGYFSGFQSQKKSQRLKWNPGKAPAGYNYSPTSEFIPYKRLPFYSEIITHIQRSKGWSLEETLNNIESLRKITDIGLKSFREVPYPSNQSNFGIVGSWVGTINLADITLHSNLIVWPSRTERGQIRLYGMLKISDYCFQGVDFGTVDKKGNASFTLKGNDLFSPAKCKSLGFTRKVSNRNTYKFDASTKRLALSFKGSRDSNGCLFHTPCLYSGFFVKQGAPTDILSTFLNLHLAKNVDPPTSGVLNAIKNGGYADPIEYSKYLLNTKK